MSPGYCYYDTPADCGIPQGEDALREWADQHGYGTDLDAEVEGYVSHHNQQGPWLDQVCDACARLLGGSVANGRLSTYNVTNACDLCERVGVPVTEARDWDLNLTLREARRRYRLIQGRPA